MKLTISFLCMNKLDVSKRCINAIIENTSPEDLKDTQFILTDNNSEDGSSQWLESEECALPNKRVIKNLINVGYGAAHTNAFILAEAPLFLVVNNDMIIKDNTWLSKIYKAFENSNVALVGINGTPSALTPDGSGYFGAAKEYVEGSFVAGRSDLFRKHGFFSPEYLFFYCEDADLSLRYRSLGFEIRHVDIAYAHLHNQTIGTLDPNFRNRMIGQNNTTFRKHWDYYLQTRKFK